MAKKKAVTASVILSEIEKILEKSKFYQSRESGKRFYDQLNLPTLLGTYIVQSGQTRKEKAKQFGMSLATLDSILKGGVLSENMLFRIRSALVVEVATQSGALVFPGQWHDVSAEKIHAAISDVSQKLVFLKKVVESSNFLHSENSPIDRIQVSQLVALLTATLEALSAPFVEKRQTEGFFRWLGKLAKKAIEKGVEKVVTDAMGDAVDAGKELVQHLPTDDVLTDLGEMI